MNYHLRLLKEHKVIISSTSYRSPLQELLELSSELKIKQYSGEVLFDLLCVNGNNPNRFISMFFNGVNFEQKTAKSLKKPDQFILSEQESFYHKNKLFIINSVLSSTQQQQYLSPRNEVW